MFTDTYFVSHETENPQEESIKRWTEEREDDGKPDPFVLGFSLTERPLLNARDYFIDVFAKRLQRVYQESDHLVSHIERSVDRYVRETSHACSLIISVKKLLLTLCHFL